MCKLDRVTRLGEYRIFRQDGEPGELSCVFRYFWEDRLPVIRAEAEVVEAFAPDGRRLYKSQQPEPAPWRISFRQGRRPPTGALVVTLTRLPEGIRKVQEIEGLVRLWIGTGKKEIAIKDVLFHPGDKASAPGLTLVLQSATRTGNRIDVAVEAEIAGPNACFIAESCTPRYGFFLEGPDRKRRPAAVERIERDLRAKAGEEKETAEKAADVTGKVTVWMKFEDLPDAAGWTLVYCGPESIKADDVRFKIKDIPVR